MIYRTRSFSINNQNGFSPEPLRRTKSTLDMRPVDAELRELRDLRRFIRVKKEDYQEASSAVNTILCKMDKEQLSNDFFKDNWENEKRKKEVGKALHFQPPSLSNILKSHGVVGQYKEVLTEEEIERKEEITRNFHRYKNAKMRFSLIRMAINCRCDEDSFFVAYYFSNPIGMLQLSTKDNIPTVVSFATDYLIRNCGYLLMEYAVNESVDLGKEGKLQLDALPRAEKAYFDMGFLKTTGDIMILEPAMSDKWHMINGHYKCIMC
ncbi:hypothetical protein [Xenorhabdus eapokensis]|uniref:N-acetyltransferase n=1 Tax=Xenorhabdus eapokensis TaxID=1873482 RepID=A0A1Q5TTC7_9GAMM|nr:hypothetical protein [Xenorhabdus eapokensis]OKP03475.1 N-acetyltransferase [Xenorhabdus eapokensis]